MVSRLVPPLVAALVGALLNAPAAHAVPFDAPTINLADGDPVSQLQPVELTGIDNQVGSVRVAFGPFTEELLVVEAHQASTSFETWGLEGSQSLTVTQCEDAEGLTCDAPIQVSVTVDNPGPTYTPSRAGSQRTHDFDVTLGLDGAVTSGTPQLAAAVDDDVPALVEPGQALSVDVDALSEGAHAVHAAVCSADGLRCTTPTTDAFEVVRTVAATFSLDPPVFSPNGDGRSDTLDLTYGLVDPWEEGVIRIRPAPGVGDPLRVIEVDPPASPATEASVSFDGRDDLAAALPAGDYVATLAVARVLDEQLIFTPYSLPFSIDLSAEPVADVALSVPTLYPSPDGYRDTVGVSWTAGEEYTRVDVEVRRTGGSVVRLLGDVAGGVVWDGRNNKGNVVAEGSYELRVRAQDVAGNRAWSPAVPITVSDKVVATRTRSVTVSATASRMTDRGGTGDCSRLRIPSWHGWSGSISYLSNTRCDGDFEASRVWTVHLLKLPAAVAYRKVRLGWYGGPTRAQTLDVARATLYKQDGLTAYWPAWVYSVNYLTGQHLPWVPAGQVMNGRQVKWAFGADSGNRYDVKNFTITYRADVLVEPG